MKDFHSSMIAVLALAPEILAADKTSEAIDLQGYNAAEIILVIGAGGIVFTNTKKIDFELTHSDDGASFDRVRDGDVLGVALDAPGILKTLKVAHADAAVYRFGYRGDRRYLKVRANFGGAHDTGTMIAAIVLKGRGYDNPQPDQA